MNLSNKTCKPCEGGIPPLSKSSVEEYKKEISDKWNIILDGKEEDVFGANRKLTRDIKFKDFKESMNFVNKLADLAESEGHHPDIKISYNKVNLEITTHAIGGLSENDFILAVKTDNLLED